VLEDHPDLVPAHEARQIREGLREIGRHLAGNYDDGFRVWLADSESRAATLEATLRAGNSASATKQLSLLEQSCKRCHAAYRN
jgi:hypothetical protein